METYRNLKRIAQMVDSLTDGEMEPSDEQILAMSDRAPHVSDEDIAWMIANRY